jgi:hypothetical protein
VITVVHKDQPVTVVAFCGIAPKNSVFEWCKTIDRLPCNFVGVRDPVSDWYQTHKQEIASKVSEAAHGKRLFIGASAGGFAALMFGRMLEADAVLAFCPQSACGKAKRELDDHRWPTHCKDTTPSCDIGGKHPNAIVHYAVNDPLDAMHANRLTCRKVEHPTGGHNLPDVLKKAGLVDDIIIDAVRMVG